jgi:hypothetical protein
VAPITTPPTVNALSLRFIASLRLPECVGRCFKAPYLHSTTLFLRAFDQTSVIDAPKRRHSVSGGVERRPQCTFAVYAQRQALDELQPLQGTVASIVDSRLQLGKLLGDPGNGLSCSALRNVCLPHQLLELMTIFSHVGLQASGPLLEPLNRPKLSEEFQRGRRSCEVIVQVDT